MSPRTDSTANGPGASAGRTEWTRSLPPGSRGDLKARLYREARSWLGDLLRGCVVRSAEGISMTTASAAALERAWPVQGLRNAYGFATFNALSYQIVLGSPMFLYATSLQATATVVGIVAGMMPLLVLFQIPAASHVPRVGYRRFMLAGWSARVMFIFVMALVPFASGVVGPAGCLVLMVSLLFGFNLSRGISSAAWLPWITTLVPPDRRGHYLARESACVNSASAVTLMLAAIVLRSRPEPWQFSILFAFSATMGAVSLLYLKRIPDAAGPESAGERAAGPIPWRAIAGHPPFRKLLGMNVTWALAYGGLTAFTVAFLERSAGMSPGWILAATGTAYCGGVGGLLLFGTRLDLHGSKPVLLICLSCWVILLGAWTAVAGDVIPVRLPIVIAFHVLMGLGYAVFSMANTRLAMVVVPPMGRSHFFALFSVVANLSLGVTPILWGLVIDAFGDRKIGLGGFELNRYSLFYCLTVAAFGVTWVKVRDLDEPRAGNVERLLQDLLRSMPVPSWMRFWPRG
jgi:MFS family permease